MTHRSRLRPGLAALIGVTALLVVAPALADPCGFPSECASGFCVDGVCCNSACNKPCQACSAAGKGSGVDGVCGLAKAGKVCDPAHCDGDSFSYVADSTCDPQGNCVVPAGVPCLHNEPCKIDLCSDTGCEQVVKLDGTDCGGGLVCISGDCEVNPTSSSSSSSSGAGGAGIGGAGGGGAGSGGAGTGGAGTGGAPGSGGGATSSGSSSASSGSPYPPAEMKSGCGCRAAGEPVTGGMIAAALAALGLAGVRRRRARR